MGKEQDLIDFVFGLPPARLESLKGNPTKVLEAIDEFPQPLMTIGKYKGKLIVEQMCKIEPNIMIELGCYVGYSAILFGNELKKYNEKGTVHSKYYSFEVNEEFAKFAWQLIDLAGLADCVEIIVGKAGHTLPEFEARLSRENDKYTPVDFIFIDHWKDMYVPDLRVLESLNLVSPGTVICADNIYKPGAPEYVKYVQSTPQERERFNSSVANVSSEVHIGRWNIIYESETVPVTNPETGHEDAVEVTKCVEFLTS